MHALAGKVKESKSSAKKEKVYLFTYNIGEGELLLIPQDPI